MNCPTCNAPEAYVGLNVIECKNKECKHFKFDWREVLREGCRRARQRVYVRPVRALPEPLPNPYIPIPSREEVKAMNELLEKIRNERNPCGEIPLGVHDKK